MKKRSRPTHNTRPSFVPSRAGQAWFDKEDAQLREEHAQGLTVTQIAQAHERTPAGIVRRLEVLKLVDH